MDFQVQGSVFVNGEWVSRTADVYQIMSASQPQEDTEMHEPEPKTPRQVPDLGVLSKTVIPTPFHKFVLSANIRHKDINDVVLVTETSIHLKEVCDYGHLRHVATKSDFNGQVLAARVFGDPRKVQVNTSEESPLLKRSPLHRGRRSATEEAVATLPPEVVVLTLTSRTLMFLWAQQSCSGNVTFRQRSIRLPAAGSSRLDRPGTFLAVDPRCRAIAVAAPEGSFMLYKTKTMDKWREEAYQGQDDPPILDEAAIRVEGRIMHMDFLSSGGDADHSHIVLIVVLVHNGRTKIACYDWDYRYGLDHSTARIERYTIADDLDRTPSLLIPLSRSPDFLLVFDQHISLYQGILSGPPTTDRSPFDPHIRPSLRPGDSKGIPHWVHWDRTPRNPEFDKEAFYLAREDGRIAYVERGINGVVAVEAGRWPYPIDTAFACLHVNHLEFSQSYPDLLLAGGAGSDGHLCKIGAWPTEYKFGIPFDQLNTFAFVESIPNWAPLADMNVARVSESQVPEDDSRAAILVANGKTPHGQISELRRGVKALVDERFGGMGGCAGLWIVDYGRENFGTGDDEITEYYATFVFTLSLESLVVRVSRTQGIDRSQSSGTSDHDVWNIAQINHENGPVDDGIIREGETVSASAWTDGYAVQITKHEARTLRRPALAGVDFVSFPNSILLAASRPGIPFIAVAFREGNKTVVEVAHLLNDGTFEKDSARHLRAELTCDPTCIQLLRIDGVPHLFVGTSDSGVRLYMIQEPEGLLSVFDTLLEPSPASGLQMVCESASLLTHNGSQLLLCGTRNGFLLSMALQTSDSRYEALHANIVRMGTTAVHTTPSAMNPSSALVACGSDFCRVRCSENGATLVDIDSIWFVDERKPAYVQGPIMAVDQLPVMPGQRFSGKDLDGFVFAVSGDHMVFARLDYEVSHDRSLPVPEASKAVPRKLLVRATPTKMLYLEGIPPKMVVATTKMKEERAPPGGYRVMHSSLELLSLYEPRVKQEEPESPTNGLIIGEIPLKHYERVYSMAEWNYVDENAKKHRFVVVGTGITTGPGKEQGRKLFLRVGKSGIRLQHERTYKHPVRCIAIYDNALILTVYGDTIVMDQFDTSGKWSHRGSKQMPSAGVHMTVSAPFVYVSTTHDSHICYEVMSYSTTGERWNGTGELAVDFRPRFTDIRQRNPAHHVLLDLQHRDPAPDADRLVLLADKSCTVAGLLHPSERTKKQSTEVIFEACLPRSVIRLRRGDIRPPWRRPCRSYPEPLQGTPGVVCDDVLGACSDGTIYSFSILSTEARRLLRLLQNLIEAKRKRDPKLQHSIVKHRSSDIANFLQNGAEGAQDGKIKARDVDPVERERGEAAPRFKHVDGDLLMRFFFEEGGDLEQLICVDTEGMERLFVELTVAVATPDEVVQADARAAVSWTRRWLSEVLMPLL